MQGRPAISRSFEDPRAGWIEGRDPGIAREAVGVEPGDHRIANAFGVLLFAPREHGRPGARDGAPERAVRHGALLDCFETWDQHLALRLDDHVFEALPYEPQRARARYGA